jgi:glutathione peroxidase
MLGRPRWNFHKYLIGRDGHIAGWFSSATAADAKKLRAAIGKALALPADENVAS